MTGKREERREKSEERRETREERREKRETSEAGRERLDGRRKRTAPSRWQGERSHRIGPGMAGRGGKGLAPARAGGGAQFSSEKREASTIMVRGMKDAKERAQINARSER